MKNDTQTIQVKLALNERLKNVWNYLLREYEALDKSDIIKLALNNLAKESRKRISQLSSIDDIFDKLEKNKTGMTEEEFFAWWNKNKPSIYKK